MELRAAAACKAVLPVDLGVEFEKPALLRVLDLIHGKIRVFAQRDKVCAALGIPRDAAGDAHVQGAAARQLDSRLLEGFVQRADIRAQGVLIVVAVEENVELVA